MSRFLLKTFFEKLLTLFLISVVSFLVIKLAPGEPAGQGEALNPHFSQADYDRLRKAFDLDKPLHIQYVRFYQKLFVGELRSYRDNQPVLKVIAEKFLNSLPLFIVGTVLTWSLAFPTGIVGAVRRDSRLDRGMMVLSYALISIPGFVFAYFLILGVVKILHLPVLGQTTFGLEDLGTWRLLQDHFWHLVLPSVLGALGGIAVLSRYVRDQMLEVIDQDYVRTALAKGCDENTVYYRHALRNALLPFVTMFGLLIPGLIGGSVITESIFAWPGLGRLEYDALLARNYPIIISINFIAAVLVLLGTWVSDLLYMVVDPRIRVE